MTAEVAEVFAEAAEKELSFCVPLRSSSASSAVKELY